MSIHGIISILATIAATLFMYNVSGGAVSLFVLFYGLYTINAIVNTEFYGPALDRDWQNH